jgi:hypothetical protein
MDGEGRGKAGSGAVRERISSYVDAQLARLLERVTSAVSHYQRGVLDARDVNRIIEHYYKAEQALSRWADSGLLADHLALLDGEGSDTFDWWDAPGLQSFNQLNAVITDRGSGELEAGRVRWPWSKVQRRDSY